VSEIRNTRIIVSSDIASLSASWSHSVAKLSSSSSLSGGLVNTKLLRDRRPTRIALGLLLALSWWLPGISERAFTVPA
jgi:hypothetical protein